MVKISDNKLDLKEISKALCGVDISIVEENYFITVFNVLAEDQYVRVYHVHSECS